MSMIEMSAIYNANYGNDYDDDCDDIFLSFSFYLIVQLKRNFFVCSNKQSESALSLEMTVKPHNGKIHCCVFSSDGKNILSCSSDGTTKVRFSM